MSTHRDLLKTTAFAATGTGIPGAAPATGAAIIPTDNDQSVNLAVATICTDGFSNHHHEPAFRILPETGIHNVEFNVWYPDLLMPAYLDSIAKRCAVTGLRPISIQGTAFGGEGHDGVSKDIAHKLRLMEMATHLGCRRVKCTGAKRGTAGGLASVIEVCRELAPAAEQMGILLALENHVDNVLENLADYEEIFAAIDSPNVGMCLDTGHFEGAGITLDSVLHRFHTRVLHVDLKDCAAFGRGHNTVVFGEGSTDFDAFLTRLLGTSYRGYLVIEMAWNEPREPVLANLIRARERFSRYARGRM